MSLATYLDLLFGAEPASAFLEVRWRLSDRPGMGQLWRPVEQAATAIEPIRSIGAKTDVYVGCAPRTRREGRKDAISRSHVLWADCDTPEAIAALERFRPVPSMVICSGSDRHAYWPAWPPVSAAEAEGANRRLAYALEADMAATDAARVLRPPNSFNWKTGEPVPVEVEQVNVDVYTVEEIVGELADPPTSERRRGSDLAAPAALDDPLLTVPPVVYVKALSGREVGRDGKARCPFHDDRTPSLHVYDEPGEGHYCFGCGHGGTIIDFGAALYGIEPRGAGYQAIRQRLASALLGREPA